MVSEDPLELVLAAFPGALVLPPTVQFGPVGTCVHCGRGCATRVEGRHEIWLRWPEPHLHAVEETTPLHEACKADYAAGLGGGSAGRPVGVYARRRAE